MNETDLQELCYYNYRHNNIVMSSIVFGVKLLAYTILSFRPIFYLCSYLSNVTFVIYEMFLLQFCWIVLGYNPVSITT